LNNAKKGEGEEGLLVPVNNMREIKGESEMEEEGEKLNR